MNIIYFSFLRTHFTINCPMSTKYVCGTVDYNEMNEVIVIVKKSTASVLCTWLLGEQVSMYGVGESKYDGKKVMFII